MHGREGATRARGHTQTGDDAGASRGTTRRIVVAVAAVTLCALAALAIAPTVHAHAYLEAATPAPYSHAAPGTTVVALRFGEAIDPHLTTIGLLDGNDRPVPGSLLFPITQPFEVRFVTDPLPEDTYTVQWRTLGRDGDLVSGHYTFATGQAPLTSDIGPTAPTTGQPHPQPTIHTAAEVVARATWSIAVALLVGLPIFESRVVNAGRVA